MNVYSLAVNVTVCSVAISVTACIVTNSVTVFILVVSDEEYSVAVCVTVRSGADRFQQSTGTCVSIWIMVVCL